MTSIASKLQTDLELVELSANEYMNKNDLQATTGNAQAGNSFGGCILYQMLLAAYLNVDSNKSSQRYTCINVHVNFILGVPSNIKLHYHVTELRNGTGFKHREVKAFYQNKVCFCALVMFALDTNNDKRAQMFGAQPTINQWPIPNPNSDHIWLNPFLAFGNRFDMNVIHKTDPQTGENLFVLDQDPFFKHLECVDILLPSKIGQGGDYYFPQDDKHHVPTSEETTQRNLFFCIRLSPPATEDPNATFDEGPWYMDHLTLAYFSDHIFIKMTPIILGYPYDSEVFKVSLDHAIHFQTTKHKTSIYDYVFIKVGLTKCQKGRVLIHMSLFNKHAEMMAYVTQEAFCVLNNRNGLLPLPDDSKLIPKL